jgi:hypothetical protein
MGGKMIKNIIIISLIAIIFLDISPDQALNYVESGLDFLKEIVYNIKSEVK